MLAKKIGVTLTVIVLSLPFHALAQSYAESALLFSRTQLGGSARIQAIGGAQVALGGDYSSVLANPAGLGMYNRHEVTFSPAVSNYSTESDFDGDVTKRTESIFNVPGFSVVLNFPKENNGFLGGSFGLSMTRINDFNGTWQYQGRNNSTSIIDYFMEQANGDTPDQFDTYHYNDPIGLSYYNYLIGPQSILDPPGPNDRYFTDAPVASDQQEIIKTKGTSYQWSFSYGANYKDVLFFGGGIGLTTLRFKGEKNFSEEYLDQDTIESMNVVERLDIRGSGINATLGVIVRPVNFFQFGVSFISPTYYQMSESYDATMQSYWNDYDYWDGDSYINLNNEEASTDVVMSTYNLSTPLKLSAGAAFISEYGFISGDIEMTNPGKARYSSDETDMSFSGDNEEIAQSFDKVINYRIGAEFRYKIFRLRGGYNKMASPFKNNAPEGKIVTLSGGAGVRLEKFYFDFALIQRESENYYSPYLLNDHAEPVVHMKNKTLTSMLTIGVTF